MTGVSSLHALDHRLVVEILEFGGTYFGDDLDEEAEDLETHPQMTMPFAAPWLAYVSDFGGRRLVDWFLYEHRRRLRREERQWLDAQREAWLSVWEVTAVEPGRTITLRDFLTREERTVQEVNASKTVERHQAVLARVVDAGSISLICGLHPIPLRPTDGMEVVESVRKLIRRKTAVSPERLRDPRVAWRMLLAWSEAVDRHLTPPRLVNRDGDALLLTDDRWKFDASRRAEIEARIATLEEADAVEVGKGILTASTNSIARADALRTRIEDACRGLLRSHMRSHSDPLAQWDEMARSAPAPARGSAPNPEADAIIVKLKEQHYTKWLDMPLPALRGKSPREVSRTKAGRAQLEAMVKDIEMIESHMPPSERYDVNKLRAALGLHKK